LASTDLSGMAFESRAMKALSHVWFILLNYLFFIQTNKLCPSWDSVNFGRLDLFPEILKSALRHMIGASWSTFNPQRSFRIPNLLIPISTFKSISPQQPLTNQG
jgi:hypothetical protein